MPLHNRFPIGPLLPTEGLLGTVFDEFFRPGPSEDRYVPSLNVTEDEDGFVLEVELPGLKPADVSVTFEDGVLTVAGHKTREEVQDTDTVHRVERRYGSFKRSMSFPTNVDGNAIAANTEHGVLTVRLPKAAESKPRRINVQSAE